jgi:hypothetical protein
MKLQERGSLQEFSFAQVLHQLFVASFNGALTLQDNDQWSKLYFDGGSPIYIESNKLDETLGRELVQRRKISESERQKLLLQALDEGKDLPSVLIENSIVTPTDLFDMLRRNFMTRVLNLFQHESGEFYCQADQTIPSQVLTVKLSTSSLILEGVSVVMSLPLFIRHFKMAQSRFYSLTGKNHYQLSDVNLVTGQLQLLNLVRQKVAYDELLKKLSIKEEGLQRLLYAFEVMELIQPSESTKSKPPARDVKLVAVEPVLQKPDAVPSATNLQASANSIANSIIDKQKIEEFANRLTKKSLQFRSQNYFELFSLQVTAQGEEIEKGFLNFLENYFPYHLSRENHRELVQKAEELLLVAASAYVVLSTPELRRSYVRNVGLSSED